MEVSLDLILTAIVNVIILAFGAAYILKHGGKRKDLSTGSDEAPPQTLKSEVADETVSRQRAAAAGEVASSRNLSDTADNRLDAPDGSAATALDETHSDLFVEESSTEYMGTVKRFSLKNGMGFITCEDTRKLHNVDVRIFRDEFDAAGVQVGDEVYFRISLSGRVGCPRNQPWATGVRALGNKPQTCGSEVKGASLRASAEEFVPTALPSGGRLSAKATEFVPGAPVTATAPSDINLVGSRGLNANAAEFVPTSVDAISMGYAYRDSRADDYEYGSPGGMTMWNEDYVEEWSTLGA